MKVYTLKEAARDVLIGVETLRRACEEKLIRATKLPNGQWVIAESALADALDRGLDLRAVPKRTRPKQPQPEHLRKFADQRRRERDHKPTEHKAGA